MIRAAITLKLCNFEETGAIIAAHTTSIPEAPGTQRNWDYRFCWLRDAYFVISALNRLGATQTMEAYHQLHHHHRRRRRRRCDPSTASFTTNRSQERIAADLAGFRGMGPVRVGNQAAEQTPARRLRQRHPRRLADVHRRAAAAHGRCGPVPPAGAAGASGAPLRTSSPTPGRGSIAAASASIRIRPPCAGSPATVSPALPAIARPRATAPAYWRGQADEDPQRDSWSGPGARSGGRSPAHSTTTISTPACCCSPSWDCCAPATSASCAPCEVIGKELSTATASSCATPPRTTSARRRPRFSSASSGTSMRWP